MNSEHERFIDALLAKMTLKEKIGQLCQLPWPKNKEDFEKYAQKLRRGEIGSIILVGSPTSGNDTEHKSHLKEYNELQRIAVEESPNGIPLIYGLDVIHGHKTVYPVPLASAASFNGELIRRCYRNIAEEAAADGIHWTFSPMLDMGRDPRWGRIVEGPGEDPLIGAMLAKAAVEGFQNGDISGEDSLAACAKHFIGYGASEGGRDYAHTEISDYALYNYYLPAFRQAVDSGVATVMSSFNDINGQPVTSSKKYLTDILRDMLGFEGYVVSDWGSVYQLLIQGVADNKARCTELAINAGVDMEMCAGYYWDSLEELVKEGRVAEEAVDTAVRRVLRVKLAKGLFERPYTRERTIDRAEHLKDSRKLAAESAVLLKNNGVLPLKKDIKVALAGPFINERRSLLGTWTLDFVLPDVTSFSEAMREKIGDDNVIINKNDGLFDSSVNCTYNADAVVLALGESCSVTGEARSLADITITPAQIELIRTMRSSGKKVIGVFFCARPIAMDGIAENFDAILYAWHSGTKAAEAACDILFGDTVPSGKTAVTFPRKTGQIPIYYNSTSSSRYVNGYYGEHDLNPYEDCLGSPYYPFGYGLSYTKFEYGKPVADALTVPLEALRAGKSFGISVDVKNIGGYDGKETVQLYIRDLTASCMRPLRELKAFEKRMIKMGETARFNFELGYKDLGFYDFDGNYTVERGKFNIYVGANSLTDNYLQIEII